MIMGLPGLCPRQSHDHECGCQGYFLFAGVLPYRVTAQAAPLAPGTPGPGTMRPGKDPSPRWGGYRGDGDLCAAPGQPGPGPVTAPTTAGCCRRCRSTG